MALPVPGGWEAAAPSRPTAAARLSAAGGHLPSAPRPPEARPFSQGARFLVSSEKQLADGIDA